jgi:hypothetical protein
MDVLGIPIYELPGGAKYQRLEQLQDVEVVDSSEVNGSVFVWDGTNLKWDAIPPGTNGQVLTANSAAPLGVQYTTPAISDLTTKGDLQGYSTAPARIAAGPNHSVLNVDTSQPAGLAYVQELFDTSGAASVDFTARHLLGSNSAVPQLDFSQDNAAAVNYIQIMNNATGQSPQLTMAGTDSNIGFTLQAKGTGSMSFTSTGGAASMLTLTNQANTVNSIDMSAALTTQAPTISVIGSDANISLRLLPKGTGAVQLSGLNYPVADGAANSVITTNGAGGLSLQPSVASSMLSTGPATSLDGTAAVTYTAFYGYNTNQYAESGTQTVVSAAAIIKNLTVYIPAPNSETAAITLSFRKNGVTTALSVTVPASTAGVFTDNVHSVAVAQGDYINLISSAGTNGSLNGSVSVIADFTLV